MPDKVDISFETQTLTWQQAMDLAVKHHTAGKLSQAENIYNQILEAEPNQSVALHLLGVIAHQGGENERAVELITKALKFKPDYAEAERWAFHPNNNDPQLLLPKNFSDSEFT